MTQRTDGPAEHPLAVEIHVGGFATHETTADDPIERPLLGRSFEDLVRPAGDTGATGGALIAAESLYRVRRGRTTTTIDEGIAVLTIRRICDEALGYLDQALQEQDVLARETTMTLFNQAALRLGHFVSVDQNFQRAVALLHTSVIASLGGVYEERHILGLRKFVRVLKENVYMSDNTLRQSMDSLQREAAFDLSAPTARAEFYDEDI